ncbi:MAG: N-acetyl-gamma-glutamyl-phosphate reductase [Muribaculaceae bacterium]|nr:N-acetyl-gamma-glutamyl-phosphate reductase [Muribaculaceae bacterium]
MIKIGILGAETIAAGELIRILINHPDVELRTVASSSEAGRTVAEVHRGLTGDTDLRIAASLTPDGHDAVFLCGENWMASEWMKLHHDNPAMSELRIIDLTGAFRDGSHQMVYGFPEYNRKALVRGARRASIPSPAAIAVETALFPLAKNLLLNGRINATVSIAATEDAAGNTSAGLSQHTSPRYADISASTRLDPIAPQEHRPDGDAIAREIETAIRAIQPSFAGNISLRLSRDGSITRGITAVIETPCGVAPNELERLYNDAYSDHNFTYPVNTRPTVADVANTNKCLLHMEYATAPDSGLPLLRITSVIDNLLKGAAGTAVHCLNLLFGLSERTGLALKASAF